MTFARALARLVPVALLASACVPGRDNPFDPNNAPEVRLLFIDLTESMTPSSRQCALVTDTRQFPSVAAVSRGRCLALEVEADSVSHLSFYLVATNGHALADAIEIEPVVGRRALLDNAFLRERPVGQALEFEARVTDEGGDHGRTRATLVLLNQRPVAVPDPDRVLRPGGHSWDPQPTYSVEFDGSGSYDADGDPLELCWQFQGETEEQCRVADDPPFTRLIPSAEGRFVARLAVSDGVERSMRMLSLVSRRKAQPWVRTFSGYGTLDPFRDEIDEDDLFGGMGQFLFLEHDPPRALVSGTAVSGSLSLRAWSDESILAELLPGANRILTPHGYDARRGWLWVSDIPFPEDGTVTMNVFDLTSDSFANETVFTTAEIPVSYQFWGNGVVDSAGALFLYRPSLPHAILAVDREGAVHETTGALLAPRVRPAEDGAPGAEVWTIDSDAGALLRFSGVGPAEIAIQDPAIVGSEFFGWITPHDLWISLPDRGLARVDLDRFESTRSLEAAIDAVAPIPADERALVDPASGEVWSFDQNATFHARIDGTFDVLDGFDVASMDHIFPDGVMRFGANIDNGGAVFLQPRAGLSPATSIHTRASAPHDPANQIQPLPTVVDSENGSLWLASRLPSLLRMWPDGRVDEWTEWVEDGVVVPWPHMSRIAVSADGTHVWGAVTDSPVFFGADVIYVIDMTTAIPTATVVLDLANPNELGALLPSYPSGEEARILRSSSAAVETIRAGEAPAPFYTPAPEELGAQIARVPGGGLCLATYVLDSMTFEFTRIVRYLDEDGVPTPLASVSIPPLEGFTDLEGARDAGGNPVCWGRVLNQFGSPYGIRAFDATGVRHSYGATTPFALRAIDGDQVWIAEEDPVSDLLHPVRLRFDPAQPSTVVEREDVDGTIESLLH